MGNKFVWKNLLINGVIGATVATVFCLLAGLQDAVGYALIIGFIVGDIVGIVVYVLKTVKEVKEKQAQGLLPKPKSKEELALEKKKQEEQNFARCAALVKSLSKKDLQMLEDMLRKVESFSNINGIDLPKQAQLLFVNIAKQKDTVEKGTLTKNQSKEFCELIGRFTFSYQGLLKFSVQSQEQAMNKGLGFGVIGDAADIALYSVMETVEKKKALNTSQRAMYNRISALMQEFCMEAFSIAKV